MANKKVVTKKKAAKKPAKAKPLKGTKSKDGVVRDWKKLAITRIAGRKEVIKAITMDNTLPNATQSRLLRDILHHVGDVSLVNGVLILI